tara:strand:- start:1121 stop:1438 length:318 start_codon:yes stop_codon:yes gene_type:complete
MPNAKCEKCSKKLETICRSKDDMCRLLNLLEARIQKVPFTNITYNITPGIKHNEIDIFNNCDGVLFYDHFADDPSNFKLFNIGDIMIGNLSISDAKKLLTVKEKK